MRILILLIAFSAGWAAEPVRIALSTRYPQPFREALQTFESRHGRNLIELHFLGEDSQCSDLDGARVVYIHEGAWPPELTRCASTAQALAKGGAAIGASMGSTASLYWRVQSPPSLATAADYVSFGGEENLVNFLAVLYKAGGGRADIRIASPVEAAEAGIYHPKAPGLFHSLAEYLAWYKSAGIVPPGAPLAGVTFFRTSLAYRDTAHIDALVAALERRGIGAVPVFAWPLRETEPLIFSEGKPAVRLLFCLNLLMPNPDDAAFLDQSGLHTINLATTAESYKQWGASLAGLPPARLSIQLNTPERAGATEPLLIATTERGADGRSTYLAPIPDRIEMAAARASRWIALGTKPNPEKRIALIYYNNPPGKASLGASYLNLIPSLVNVLARLQREGYLVDTRIPTEEQLKGLLMLSGRNVGEYAPGELNALLTEGHVALLPMDKYEEWYRALPAEFRAFTEKTWGKPAQSKQMVVRSEGKAYFMIPGIRLGNIFLGPQPLRGELKDEAGRQHDPNFPVPHSYIACYLWYRNQFGADAIVHMGRHGTLEWLPGKAVAQSGSDTGEVLIGDLPHAYYYVVDGGGEFLQSKRRSGAVMVSHLTPLLVSAGIPPEHRKLHDAIENRARVLQTNETLRKEYETEIVAEARRLKLDRQLGFSLETESAEKIVERVEAFIHDVEAQPIPMGMHTIGAAPDREVLREALAQFIESAFSGEEAARARPWAERWAAALVERKEPEGPADLLGKVREDAKRWLTALEESPSQELLSLIQVLNGRYLPTGVSGDPLRSPGAVPTGRNMHDLDPRMFPTKAAWEVGQRMAGKLLDQWAAQNGKYPEKLSFVLWYGEATRHQGVAESQALSLLGVEPVWNGRGHVDDVKLIPASKLGRPRVDVVLTISGLYRDGMPEKMRLLDKAVRLAAAAPDDNPVRRNTRRVEQALRAQGVEETTARAAAGTRVFGPAPGAFGAGISGMMESSRDQGDQKAVGEAYMRNMGYGYGDGVWGKNVNGNLREQLRDNEGVIHSRSTNLYGVLDNDETYQFAGGLAAATTASGGREPRIMISNVRKPGEERMEDMKQFVTRELSSRLWNPKWIEGMKKSGYSGAREMASEVEHLYGLRSTAPSTVDESVWQETFDVYIADKNRLGLKEYFAKENPHARQVLTARLLEVDRQGIYRFTETDRKALVRTYIESVNRDGISCYSNACDNRRLASYVLKQAPGAVSRAAFEEWTNRMTAATTAPRSGRPVTASAKQPFVVARRSLRIFEISNGRIHIVGHDVDWKWVPLSAIALLLGSCLSAAVLRRRAGSYIVLALADGGGDSASMVSTTLRR